MFNQLLESKPKKERSVGATVFSTVLHGVLIAGAIYVTAQAATADEKPKEEKIEFVETKPEEPKPEEPKPAEPEPPPPDVVAAPPPPKGFQVLQAPVDIPDVIPDVDLTRKVTDEADFTGKGVAGGIAKGVEGGTGPVVTNTDQPYFEFQVEKPVVAAPGGCQPKYPEMLRTAGVTGTVQAQFVVDTTGRIQPGSFKALSQTHELFVAEVRKATACMRFLPAETGGKKVRQLVQQPFSFDISK